MVASLCVLFEILSIVFCLHYLYGEKIRLEPITIGFVVVEIIWMSMINFLQLNQKWSLMIYPMVILFCGLRFGFNVRTIFVNTILYTIILSPLQATMMLLFRILAGGFGIIEQLFMNIILLIIVVVVFGKCNLYRLSRILQKGERIVTIVVSIIVVSIFVFLLNYKQSIGFDIFYYVVLLVDIFLIGIVIVDIGKHKVRVA